MRFYTELLGLDCNQLQDAKRCLFVLITFKTPGLCTILPPPRPFQVTVRIPQQLQMDFFCQHTLSSVLKFFFLLFLKLLGKYYQLVIPQKTKQQSGKNKKFNVQQERRRTICHAVPNKRLFAFTGGQWGKSVGTTCNYRLARDNCGSCMAF